MTNGSNLISIVVLDLLPPPPPPPAPRLPPPASSTVCADTLQLEKEGSGNDTGRLHENKVGMRGPLSSQHNS